jgi:hypothetical protein
MAAVAAAAAPSLVRVELTLRYDKGDPPRSAAWTGGSGTGRGHDPLDVEAAVKEERPMELGGFLIAPNQVVAPDPMINPRFIQSIAVRFKDEVVKARPIAYGKDQVAVILELERPLKGAKPLVFEPRKKPPYLTVTYDLVDGAWTANIDAMPSGVSVSEDGRRVSPAPLNALVVDRNGVPVALSMHDEMPADEAWKVAPSAWPVYTAEDFDKLIAATRQRCETALVCVTLHFRSPSKDATHAVHERNDEAKNATEQHATGLLVSPTRVLILAGLRPSVTARLERITVCRPKGEPASARFEHSLADYGVLTATLEKPMDGVIAFSAQPIVESRGILLPAAEVLMHGENRTAYYDHRRIEGLNVGWRRQVYPQVLGDHRGLFLFDAAGALVALPVARREKIALEDRYESGPGDPVLTPAAYLKAVLDDVAKYADAHNVPLTEQQESRLAWLGAELQPLNRALARENKVSELTRDGESGAMVAYVYPGSPAAKAGIEPGYILLRLIVEGQPKPLEVQLDRDDYADGPFPWDELDELQERYYDRVPPPWPAPENAFTRALTDLGFGTKFKAEFFHDGQVVTKDFEVTQSPPHFEAAPRFKADGLGIAVRDLTYEVRRYFQKKDDEPGVIISKIEPGKKASVAGIKPYEIITHVNDKPVMNVKDFEKAIAGQDELRLSVKRMTRGRVVKIVMSAPLPPRDEAAETPAAEPKAPAAEPPAPDDKPPADDGGKRKPARRPK